MNFQDEKKVPGKEMPIEDDYDDDNIPEIDLPKETSITEGFPTEFPGTEKK